MSAAPFLGSRDPREVYSRPRRVKPAVWDEPELAAEPDVISVPKVRVKSQARPATSAYVACLRWIVTATAAGFVAYGASALLGKSSIELERRDYAQSTIRARIARADVTRLKLAYDRLTTEASFAAWALDQGFVPRHAKPVVPVQAGQPTDQDVADVVVQVGDAPETY